jgi:serine/threonine-protein kinase
MGRALSRDPNARFASAKELAEAFMIATGAAASLDRDLSSSLAQAGPGLVGERPVDSKRAALEKTIPIEGPPLASNPLSHADIRLRDQAPTAPPATASSRLPWILVVILSVAVVVLAGLLAFHRN